MQIFSPSGTVVTVDDALADVLLRRGWSKNSSLVVEPVVEPSPLDLVEPVKRPSGRPRKTTA